MAAVSGPRGQPVQEQGCPGMPRAALTSITEVWIIPETQKVTFIWQGYQGKAVRVTLVGTLLITGTGSLAALGVDWCLGGHQ